MRKVNNCLSLGSTSHDPNNRGGCRNCHAEGIRPFTLSQPRPYFERFLRTWAKANGQGTGRGGPYQKAKAAWLKENGLDPDVDYWDLPLDARLQIARAAVTELQGTK